MKTMNKEEKQRIYDAMLIKAWRKDITCDRLRYWLRPYNICITDPELIRTPKWLPIRVAVFVGAELKPLSDKLFDGNPADDIKILNWLGKSGLKCQKTNRNMHKDLLNNAYQIKRERNENAYRKETYFKTKLAKPEETKIRGIGVFRR